MTEGSMDGTVFVQTNEPQNLVIAFRRDADGGLVRLDAYSTAGAGNGEPHLPSQGSVVVTGDGRYLLVTNAGSDDLTVFAISNDGALSLLGRVPAGATPGSVAEHGGLVYALATGSPALMGFRLTEAGLAPIDGAEQVLAADGDPAQVGFTPDGSALILTERGTDSIVSFPVEADGRLGAMQTLPSSGPTPYGFAVTGEGTLVVTEAFRAQKGAAAASSYRVAGAEITPVTKSVGNGRSEICWAVVTSDGRYAFTTNFADGAVSRWAIGQAGDLVLDDAAAGLSEDGRPGLRDEALTADGRFLYAIDADSGSIFGWGVGDGGSLAPLGSWGGLPATVAGIAAL